MNCSGQTAISEKKRDMHSIVHKLRATFLSAVLCVYSVGCAIPRAVMKGTGAEGVVLDQHDEPVPNAPMQASWYWFPPIPPLWVLMFFCQPSFEKKFRADEQGQWRFYKRGVSVMGVSVRVLVPSGYEAKGGGRISTGPVEDPRDSLTNVVFRLWKVEGVEQERIAPKR